MKMTLTWRRCQHVANMHRRFGAVFVTALMSTCLALAGTTTVDSVAGLISAIGAASDGDTIVLAKSGSPYVFTDVSLSMGKGGYQSVIDYLLVVDKNLVLAGEDDSPWASWTTGEEPVVIDGNDVGGILHAVSGKSVTLKNITFTGGKYNANYGAPLYGASCASGDDYLTKYDKLTCTNCVFRQNSTTQSEDYGFSAVFGAALRDCLITNNIGCAVRGSHLFGCNITGSTSSPVSLCSAYDCIFSGNSGTFLAKHVGTFSNCTIRANTSSSGPLITRISLGEHRFLECLFESNSVVASSMLRMGGGGTFADCIFRGNAVFPSVLENPKTVSGCTFDGNVGYDGCAVRITENGLSAEITGCVFRTNSVRTENADRSGGAIYMKRTSSALCSVNVTDCVFEGNAAGKGSGSGGAIHNEGSSLPSGEKPWESFNVRRCTFTTNMAAQAAGVCGVHAVDCTFDRNFKTSITGWRLGNAARDSVLEQCGFNDAGLHGCVVNGCNISGAETSTTLFSGYTRVTNTLVERCTTGGEAVCMYYFLNNEMNAEFVNCTFVANKMYTYYSNGNATATNGISFVNCLFNGNMRGSFATDFDVYTQNGTYPDLLDQVSFVSTYYGDFHAGAVTAERFVSLTNSPVALVFCENPRFAGMDANVMKRYPSEPYWALSWKSPLLGGGRVARWMDDAVDLAGRPRLRNGAVDPGCYQCWLNAPGLIIKIR